MPFIWQFPNADLSLYSAMGHGLLEGRELYADLWDHKPPLFPMVYALTELLTGQGLWQYFVLGSLIAVGTLIGVYRAGRWHSENAGRWAALTWVPVSAMPWVEAHQPNSAALVTFCIIWAFVYVQEAKALPAAFWFLAATLTKHNAVFIPATLAVGLWFRREPKEWVREVGTWLLVGVFGWALVWGYFAATGRAEDFRIALIDFNRHHKPSLVVNLLAALLPGAWTQTLVWLPLAFVAIVVRKPGALLLALFAGSWVTWASPGRFYLHHFQHLLLPLVLMCALATRLGRQFALASMTIAWVAALRFVQPSANAPFETRVVTQEIASTADRLDGTVFVLGVGTEAYRRKGEFPGVFFSYHATGPFEDEWHRRAIEWLEAERPRWVLVDEQLVPRDHWNGATERYLLANYRFLPQPADSVLLMERR